jgi:ribonuclease T2
MRSFWRWGALAAIGMLLAGSLEAKKKKQPGGPAQPGVFDFYLMSLSWSPQHCAQKPTDKIQCSGPKPFGFVLHGLWPQYNHGYSASCSTSFTLDQTTINSMMDIMPSQDLIRHEWSKHGTCSGLNPPDYFAKARTGFQSISVPAQFSGPVTTVNIAPADFKKALIDANQANHLSGDEFAIACSGRYLSEVRICLDKDLHPRACSSEVKDSCSSAEIIVRPVR